MVARTGFPGTAGNTTHLASEDNSLPGGWLGYVEVTSSQSGIGAETDITGLSQAVTVNTSRRIRITAFVPAVQVTAADTPRIILRIKESTTVLAEAISSVPRTGASFGMLVCEAVETPSSGSHTYKASFTCDQTTGTATLNFSSTAVGFLLIEDIGPSS